MEDYLFNAELEDQTTAVQRGAALHKKLHFTFEKSVSRAFERVDQLEELVAQVQNIAEEDRTSIHAKLDQLACKQSRQVV